MGLREGLVLLLQLREQPHVLDGDDRLVGEGLQKRDLLVRERDRLSATEQDHTDRRSLSQQGNAERRPLTGLSGERASLGILLRFPLEIGHGNSLPLEHGAPRNGPPHDRDEEANSLGDKAVVGLRTQVPSVEPKNGCIRGPAEARGTLDYLVQYWLEVRRGRAADGQDLGHGRLLLLRLSQFAISCLELRLSLR